MDSRETLDFARRLMNEIWLPLDPEPVPRFYDRDVVGWNRKQRLNYDGGSGHVLVVFEGDR